MGMMILIGYLVGAVVALFVCGFRSRTHYYMSGADALLNALTWPIALFCWVWDTLVNRR